MDKILCVVILVLALFGTLLPGRLLVWQSEQELYRVSAAPAEYYSAANLALAHSVSEQLETYQRLQLVAGEWESTIREAATYEGNLKAYEAVQMAKTQMESLYQQRLYPVDLKSDYGNWYTWDAEFYKAVDATFDTYAAYYWEITFRIYDGLVSHRVCMLEDGTIFLAEANVQAGLEVDRIRSDKEWVSRLLPERGEEEDVEVTLEKITEPEIAVSEALTYPNNDTVGLQWLGLTQASVGEEQYRIIQVYSENRYLVAVCPMS